LVGFSVTGWKIAGVVGATFLIALVIVIYAPSDCIKVEFFNQEIQKCKTLVQQKFPGEAQAHLLDYFAFAQIQKPTDISGSWNVSGHAGDHFILNGTANFSSSSNGKYQLVSNEVNESGVYHYDGKTLSLTSNEQKTITFDVSNLKPNSFNIVSADARQQYHLSR